jgi:hypothetical protein
MTVTPPSWYQYALPSSRHQVLYDRLHFLDDPEFGDLARLRRSIEVVRHGFGHPLTV